MKVPLRFCSLVLKENLENTASVFIALKFLFVEGNFFMDDTVLDKVRKMCLIKSKKTVQGHFNKLVELNWIWINEYNELVNLKSFSNILYQNGIEDYYFFNLSERQLKKFKGFLGATLFTYCSYKFWRAFVLSNQSRTIVANVPYSIFKRRGRRVIISDVTNKLISPLYYSKLQTPVALILVSKCFQLSKSKVNRLKLEAIKCKFLKVKGTFKKIDIPFREFNFAKAEKVIDYALKYNKKLYQREIDLIRSELFLYKTRKWKKSKL
jgi:hypothetical protein